QGTLVFAGHNRQPMWSPPAERSSSSIAPSERRIGCRTRRGAACRSWHAGEQLATSRAAAVAGGYTTRKPTGDRHDTVKYSGTIAYVQPPLPETSGTPVAPEGFATGFTRL